MPYPFSYYLFYYLFSQGPYIKYIRGGQGSRNIFGKYSWVVKYFWKFMMAHKFFLCDSFQFFFWVTSSNRLWGSEHKMFKLVIKSILKKNKTFLKVSKIQLVIWQILIIDVFWPCCGAFLHYDWAKDIYFYDKIPRKLFICHYFFIDKLVY